MSTSYDAVASGSDFSCASGRVGKALPLVPDAVRGALPDARGAVRALLVARALGDGRVRGRDPRDSILDPAVAVGPAPLARSVASAPQRFGPGAALPLALVVLGLPLAAGLGPFWLLLWWAVLVFPYAVAAGAGDPRGVGLVVMAAAPVLVVRDRAGEHRAPLAALRGGGGSGGAAGGRRRRGRPASGLVGLPGGPGRAGFCSACTRSAPATRRAPSPPTTGPCGRSEGLSRARQPRQRAVRGGRLRPGEPRLHGGGRAESAGGRGALQPLGRARRGLRLPGTGAAIARGARRISESSVDPGRAALTLSRVVPAAYSVERARGSASRSGTRSRRAAGSPATCPNAGFSASLRSPTTIGPLAALLLAVRAHGRGAAAGSPSECVRCGRPFCARCKRPGEALHFCSAVRPTRDAPRGARGHRRARRADAARRSGASRCGTALCRVLVDRCSPARMRISRSGRSGGLVRPLRVLLRARPPPCRVALLRDPAARAPAALESRSPVAAGAAALAALDRRQRRRLEEVAWVLRERSGLLAGDIFQVLGTAAKERRADRRERRRHDHDLVSRRPDRFRRVADAPPGQPDREAAAAGGTSAARTTSPAPWSSRRRRGSGSASC